MRCRLVNCHAAAKPLAALVFLLAGCGGTVPEDEPAATTPPATVAPAPAAPQPATPVPITAPPLTPSPQPNSQVQTDSPCQNALANLLAAGSVDMLVSLSSSASPDSIQVDFGGPQRLGAAQVVGSNNAVCSGVRGTGTARRNYLVFTYNYAGNGPFRFQVVGRQECNGNFTRGSSPTPSVFRCDL